MFWPCFVSEQSENIINTSTLPPKLIVREVIVYQYQNLDERLLITMTV